MKQSLLQCAVVAAVLGSACADALPRPQVPLAARWSVLPPAAAGAAGSTQGEPSWWSRFHCAELIELQELALAHSLEGAAASARVAQQEALARVAKAPLFPVLGLEVLLSAQSANSKSLGSIRGGFFDAGLTASYALDVWGEQRQRAAAAQADSDAARSERAATELRIVSGVAQTYFEVLSLRERIKRAQANLEATERVLEIARARERAGAALARDVAQQETLVASAAVHVEQLTAAEVEARVTLAVASGRQPGAIEIRGGSLDGIEDPVLHTVELGVPASLLARRPDVARAEREWVAARAGSAAARAARLPQLTISGAVGAQTAFLATEDNGTSLVYVGGFALTQPLFDGGARSAQQDAAAARRAEAEANYRRTVLEAVGEVERSLAAVRGAERQYAHQQRGVSSSRRAFELTLSEYLAGAADMLSVLDTQRTLFRAEDEHSQVHLAKLRAEAMLIQSLGSGWSLEK